MLFPLPTPRGRHDKDPMCMCNYLYAHVYAHPSAQPLAKGYIPRRPGKCDILRDGGVHLRDGGVQCPMPVWDVPYVKDTYRYT